MQKGGGVPQVRNLDDEIGSEMDFFMKFLSSNSSLSLPTFAQSFHGEVSSNLYKHFPR